MASKQTPNYGLNQWEAEDKVIRTEFNADNLKVDTALASKASQADLTALTSTVNTKAAQTALNSLSTTVTNLSNTVTTGLAKKYGTDNPYIVTGTYTGDGATTRTITIGFRPSYLIVYAIYPNGAESGYYMRLSGTEAFQHLRQYSGNSQIQTTNLKFLDRYPPPASRRRCPCCPGGSAAG